MSMEIQQVTATAPAAPVAPVQRETPQALPGDKSSSKAEDKRAPSQEDVKHAVKDIQDFVSTVTTDLRFTVDKETGKTVVSVGDSKTKQIVRQIPSEEIMKIARNIDRMQGLLFSDKA